MRFLALVIVWLLLAAATPSELIGRLDTSDPAALGNAVAAIEREPTTPELADVLFAAGRACEDRLFDPARALALYERIVRELPDAGVSIAASRRIAKLRGTREHAREAAQLAELQAIIDALPAAEVERRVTALAALDWPGALDAMLLHADWLCRSRRYGDAQARYAAIVARAPDSESSSLARRNAVDCAITAGDWSLAERLSDQIVGDEDDEATRSELLATIALGKRRVWLYGVAWFAMLAAVILLLASLVEACVRGGLRAPAAQPPVEVLYIAPVAVVVVLVAYAIDAIVAPAVVAISIAGLASAWLSGATLDLVRARGRGVRVRAVAHVLACAALVIAIGYIVMTREGLLDMLGETVKFGPGA